MEELGGLHYMTEGGSGVLVYRDRAIEALKTAKEIEANRKTIPVWVDHNTTKLIDMEKVKKRKMELIRVKMGKGELVWMEKKVAIKNGFINE